MAQRSPVELRIASRVKSLRETQGLSQEALARLAKTSRSQVTLIEQGRRAPTISTVEAFARALRVPLSRLVEEDNERGADTHAPDRADRLAATVREMGPRFLTTVEKVVKAMKELAESGGKRRG